MIAFQRGNHTAISTGEVFPFIPSFSRHDTLFWCIPLHSQVPLEAGREHWTQCISQYQIYAQLSPVDITFLILGYTVVNKCPLSQTVPEHDAKL